MAERFSGPYSPEPKSADGNRFRGQTPARVNLSARILYLAPLPLFVRALGGIIAGNAVAVGSKLGAFALMMLGAWLLNQGLKAEAAYDARSVARPPAVPRKALSALAIAAGVGIAVFDSTASIINAGGFAIIALIAHVVAFGFDPMKKKGLAGVNEFEVDRVARAVDKAEATVAEMMDAAKRIGDRGLTDRIERLASSARDVFRTVENDPRDLRRARKFMTVYLYGARDATIKFADLWTRQKDPETRVKYEALLTDLETSFIAHREQLLLDNRSDLDVEIDVLAERLQQEGIPARSGDQDV